MRLLRYFLPFLCIFSVSKLFSAVDKGAVLGQLLPGVSSGMPDYRLSLQELAKHCQLSAWLRFKDQPSHYVPAIYDILSKQERFKHLSYLPSVDQNTVLTHDAVQDLRLFTGDYDPYSPAAYGQMAKSLACSLTRQQTLPGMAAFYSMLARPTQNVYILKKRQSFIRKLVEDDSFYAQVKNFLDFVAKHQNSLLHFVALTPDSDPQSILNPMYEAYFDAHRHKNAPGFLVNSWRKLFDSLNRKDLILSLLFVPGLVHSIAMLTRQIFSDPIKHYKGVGKNWDLMDLLKNDHESDGVKMARLHNLEDHIKHGWNGEAFDTNVPGRVVEKYKGSRTLLCLDSMFGMSAIPRNFRNQILKPWSDVKADFNKGAIKGSLSSAQALGKNAWWLLVSMPLDFCNLAWPLFFAYELVYKKPVYFAKQVYQKNVKMLPQAFEASYAHVNVMSDFIKNLRAQIDSVSALASHDSLRLFAGAQDFFAQANFNEDFHMVSGMIGDKLFRERPKMLKPAYMGIMHHGKVLKAYKGLYDSRKVWYDFIQSVGEIDALFGVASLWRQIKSAPVGQKSVDARGRQIFANSMCLVDFMPKDDSNPVVKCNGLWNPFVQPFWLSVPNDISLAGQSVMLTGPNRGGKSTFMRAFMTSTLFAQVFGVAFAQSLTMTPFAYLTCFERDAERPAEEHSSFSAQLAKVDQILREIKTLKPEEKALFIGDEIFKGTNERDAVAITAAVAQEMSEAMPGCMAIFSSHQARAHMIPSMTADKFVNYRIAPGVLDGKAFKWSFKVEPGVNEQSTAEVVAGEVGFSPALLDRIAQAKKALV